MRFSARLVLRVLATLTVMAYLGTASLEAVAAASSGMADNTSLPYTSGDQSNPTPCKSMSQNCCFERGCALLAALPLPPLVFLTTSAWSSVRYRYAAERLRGRTPAPALGPPIRRA